MSAHGPNVRAYRAAIVSFVIAIGGGIAAAIGYATEQTGDLLGLGLAAALIGIGFGLVCWAKFLDFDEHAEIRRGFLRAGHRRLIRHDRERAAGEADLRGDGRERRDPHPAHGRHGRPGARTGRGARSRRPPAP